MPESSKPAAPSGHLFRTYALLINALVGTLLLVSAVLSLSFSYSESRSHLVALQLEQAQGAAARIEQYVADIEQQLGWTALAGMGSAGDPLELRRIDYLKLLRQVPAITEAAWLDAQGREQVHVSRLAMDAQGQAIDRSAEPVYMEPKAGRVYRSPVSFRKQTEPYMTIARRAGPGAASGVTVVEVNLKFVWDVVARIHPGGAGLAYAVDGSGALIAHPDISLVLKQTSLAGLPQVAASLQAGATQADGPSATPRTRVQAPSQIDGLGDDARDLAGQPVLSSWARLDTLGWRVFVESPRSQALEPVYASLKRLGLLLAVGLLISVLASAWLARALVRPIRALQEGAARIGAGDLEHRIDISTGGELQALAGEFNHMADELKASHAGLEHKVEARTAELAEALAYQTATAEVLQVIGSSVADASPVFLAILERCEQLIPDCESMLIDLVDGDQITLAGYRVHVVEGSTPESRAARERQVRAGYPHSVQGSATEAAHLAGRVVVVADTSDHENAPLCTQDFARRRGRGFSLMMAPMIWEGRALGSIGAVRRRGASFRDEEQKLLKTFADQAVIAIQNARLFNDTQEALAHQTASADVLQVIGQSMADARPVYDAILHSCERLFAGAHMGITLAGEDGLVRLAAHRGPVVDRQAFEQLYPMPFSMASGSGSTILQRRVLHWPDVDADASLPVQTRRACEAAGSRALLMAPLLWGDRGIGAIFVGRAKAGPFSAKDIAMVETFADQAVIAIQNARLFNDTQEALAQQTAIAELVKAMSRTSFQLEALLPALIENATRLCKADRGFVFLREGDDYVMRVQHGSIDNPIALRPLREEMGTLVGRTALTRGPVAIDDALSDPSYTLKDAQQRLGYRSMLGVPMLRDGQPIGVISLWRDEVRPFGEQDQRLLSTFADQAVIAIENARLFEQLQAKTEQLEVAGRHKSEFLANMSHELRTPLNAIIGFSEVLVEQMFGEVNAKQMEYLKDIHGSGQHLLTLINDVLDLSKIEAGHMELELSEVDLSDLLEHTLALVRERAARNGLTLVLDVPADLPLWVADARKVKQVLLNLLSNAVKFTPAGGSVTLSARLDETGTIEIAVADTGVGIAPRDQAAVFEAFRQASGSYLRKSEGTGLGLALAQRFVELHGGRLGLSSEPGHGSTFTFTLPALTLAGT